MAMSELKFPMLKHSWATSMKNSIIRARCFFFTGCEEEEKGEESVTARRGGAWRLRTYHADLGGHQVAQPVEPVDVGLQVTGFTLTEETLEGKGAWSDGVVISINVREDAQRRRRIHLF